MKKSERQKVFDKYGGKCAYCGCELTKGWHVDEIDPVVRYREIKRDENGRIMRNDNGDRLYTIIVLKPENFRLDNQNPACASCNINKHSDDLETFRQRIKQFVQSLNLYSVQYKIAKRYGLLSEIDKPVVFYFETLPR